MKKTNQGQKQKCKDLYFEYKPLQSIITETGVNRNTLHSWIHGRSKTDPDGWKFQRESQREETIRDEHEIKLIKIEKVLQMTADFVAYSLQERINKKGPHGKPIPFSYKEAMAASQIALNMKKLGNLEEGLPTEILGINATINQAPSRSATVLELKEAIKKDPFMIGILPKEEITEDVRSKTTSTNGEPLQDDSEWNDLLESPNIEAEPSGHPIAPISDGGDFDNGSQDGCSGEDSDFES